MHALLLVLFLLGPRIQVLANFEGGSIGKVTEVSPAHLRCAVKGQSDQNHRNRQANWDYFELTNLPREPVTIDLVDLAGEYNYNAPVYAIAKGVRPVYSYDRIRWRHFTNAQVSWDPREPHLTLHFTPESDRIWIAHVRPYTTKDLANLLHSFPGSPYPEVKSVGHTVQGGPMPLWTITNPRIPAANKKVIWLMFRQHAWETGSSWACDGAVRFLLSNRPRAAHIRNTVVYKIFPMADPDGVADGAVRFNQNGYDLNRNWDTPNPRTMPEIWSQRKAILDWVDSGQRLDLFLSLHNDETNEYLEAPARYRALAERIFNTLVRQSSFSPSSPVRNLAVTTTPGKPGRMQVDQGLYHDRGLPSMLMEQRIEYDSKLGRVPTADDRIQFGAELVQCLAEAVTGERASAAKDPKGTSYPPSRVIRSASWDFKHLIRLANTPGKGGSDLWPTTWASNGNVYTGFGDGGGFSGASDNMGRVSMGFARIVGSPPHIKGVDVWGSYPKYAEHPATFCGKPFSMISVGGVLYSWVGSWYNPDRDDFVPCPSNPHPPEDRLAWSRDYGATWTLSKWQLTEQADHLVFVFLNFGKDDNNAKDHEVYLYGQTALGRPRAYLARATPANLRKDPVSSGAYRYFTGSGWSSDFSKARVVYSGADGRRLMHVVYDPGLRRYIASAQGHGVGDLTLLAAPEPWGPWTTIASYQNWGGFGRREPLGVDFPTKWISKDGKTLWGVFSGGRLNPRDGLLDSFNLVKLTFEVRRQLLRARLREALQ